MFVKLVPSGWGGRHGIGPQIFKKLVYKNKIKHKLVFTPWDFIQKYGPLEFLAKNWATPNFQQYPSMFIDVGGPS